MRIPWELALAYMTGLVVLGLLGYALLVPMRFFWRMAAGGVLGAVALWLINVFGAAIGIDVAINPFTALAVGLLGLPGAALVVALTMYL